MLGYWNYDNRSYYIKLDKLHQIIDKLHQIIVLLSIRELTVGMKYEILTIIMK
jgi:hypothetical protein